MVKLTHPKHSSGDFPAELQNMTRAEESRHHVTAASGKFTLNVTVKLTVRYELSSSERSIDRASSRLSSRTHDEKRDAYHRSHIYLEDAPSLNACHAIFGRAQYARTL